MATTKRPIIDIEVNNRAFEDFRRSYSRWQSQLKRMPDAWKQVTTEIDGSKKNFNQLVSKFAAANVQAQLIAKAQKTADVLTRSQASSWQRMSRDTKEVANNIGRATTSLLRWASLTTVFSGLIGAGGLFGIDRLAANVSQGRRSSTGLSVSYGEQQSFETNYGRVVDSNSFLSSINSALHDVSKRSALYGAGLTEGDLAGKNSAQVATQAIQSLKRLADQTPDSQLAQVMQARGLDQFLGLQGFQRLKNTSRSELNGIGSSYGRDVSSMQLGQDTQRAWQNFSVQMSRVGNQMENTFIKGLAPLVPGLEKLSEQVEKTIRVFLGGDAVKRWMDLAGEGIQNFAKYIATPEFENNVKNVAEGIGGLAKILVRVGKWFGGVTSEGRAQERTQEIHDLGLKTPGELRRDRAEGNATAWSQLTDIFSGNNPGNLRRAGQSSGFAQFSSPAEGLRAMARQLKLYQNRDGLNTLQGIIGKYAPASENDVDTYVGNVSKRTGFGANEKLNLNDPETLSKVISAMTKQENSKSNYTPKVVIEVLNNTGGNSIVTTNQVAQ